MVQAQEVLETEGVAEPAEGPAGKEGAPDAAQKAVAQNHCVRVQGEAGQVVVWENGHEHRQDRLGAMAERTKQWEELGSSKWPRAQEETVGSILL